MLEIQDAARVITESIDSHAKVIFGAIKDDKLKKNEIKVTVIATGFPEESLPGMSRSHITRQAPTPMVTTEREPEEEVTRGRIFNSLPRKIEERSPEPTPVASSPAHSDIPRRDPKPVDPTEEVEDEDDWGAVPAFLRRSKLK